MMRLDSAPERLAGGVGMAGRRADALAVASFVTAGLVTPAGLALSQWKRRM
jgi:hypothetical protein